MFLQMFQSEPACSKLNPLLPVTFRAALGAALAPGRQVQWDSQFQQSLLENGFLGIMFLESVCLAAGLASGSVIGLANEIMRTVFISLDCYGKIHKICYCFLPGNNSRGCCL